MTKEDAIYRLRGILKANEQIKKDLSDYEEIYLKGISDAIKTALEIINQIEEE